MRKKYRLSEAQLGEIDPGSVTIKLATLGMRGVAANILWEKATDYKMRKDWTNFGATLNQITKVQPNFINVWTNQAWNLSYNISVEFDDYRERYRWVIKGFKFLDEGIKYNKDQPRLQWEMGRMVSQKIGKADEVKQYRRLLADDTDYRDSLPLDLRDACLDYRGRPDNWLVGKGWYEKSVGMIDELKTPMMGQSPLIYRSSAPMCQMNYAEAMEKDGVFGEVAQKAWADASSEWRRYGSENIPSSYKWEDSEEPVILHLNDEEAEAKIAKEKVAQLEKMQPGLREKMIAEKKAALTAAQRLALDTPAAQRTAKQNQLAGEAGEAIKVAHDEVARRISGPPEKRDAAKKLANEARDHELLSKWTNNYRSIVNFNYWRQHAKTEQGRDLRTARQLIFKGDRAYADGDMIDARTAYVDGLRAWRKVLDAHPEYLTDQTTNEDLIDIIRRYRHVLAQDDRTLPEPFILQDVINVHQREFGGAPLQEEEKPKKEKKAAVGKNAGKKKADKKNAK